MERAGSDFKRVMTVYGIYSSNLNSPEFEPIEREMGPILASLSSKIYQNKKLFKRIETFTILPIKGLTRATTVNLVELYQFCQGRSKFKS
jgi:peptidyl-dipeptidase Dcp